MTDIVDLMNNYKVYANGCYHFSCNKKWSDIINDPSEKISEKEVVLCRKWLKVFAKKSSKLNGTSSYHYKHVVERFYQSYVTNGSFILAAILEGFEYKPDGLNCYFKFNVISRQPSDSCDEEYQPVAYFKTYEIMRGILDPDTSLYYWRD